MLYVEPNREPHLPCRFFEYIYLFQLRSSEHDNSKDSDSCDSDSCDTTVTVIVFTLLTLTEIPVIVLTVKKMTLEVFIMTGMMMELITLIILGFLSFFWSA